MTVFDKMMSAPFVYFFCRWLSMEEFMEQNIGYIAE